ncbi:MAG: YfcE family phosphodiesterase [Pirellulales bacterium]|nr:YfcE family phosphodiesterase [Pirellulales bacterium]
MLIGIISDTHGDVHAARRAVRIFESLEVETFIHCGDVGTSEVVSLFSSWAGHFVLGNVDRPATIGDVIVHAGHVCHDRFGSLTLQGKSIALLHGDDAARLRDAIRSGQWDLICHGHTHSPSEQRDGGTLIVNPGAVARTSRSCVATVELPSMTVSHIALD